MIFIDGEEWPPSIHGTGEDFLIRPSVCSLMPTYIAGAQSMNMRLRLSDLICVLCNQSG